MPELLILRHAKSSWKFPDLAEQLQGPEVDSE